MKRLAVDEAAWSYCCLDCSMVFYSWAVFTRELLCPFEVLSYNLPSPVLCIPQPECLPDTNSVLLGPTMSLSGNIN